MTPPIWVAVLHISPRTAQKIIEKHHLDPEEVRSAVVCRKGLVFTWDDDPERGRRALVEVYLGSRRTLVVLYPASSSDSDVWNLGSAYPLT